MVETRTTKLKVILFAFTGGKTWGTRGDYYCNGFQNVSQKPCCGLSLFFLRRRVLRREAPTSRSELLIEHLNIQFYILVLLPC